MTQTAATPTPRIRQRVRSLDASADAGHVEGYLRVKRTRYGSESETVVNETILVPAFPTDPARLKLAAGETINMGDFNSVRVDVELTLPCLPEETEIARVYAMMSDTVERWLEREVARNTTPNWQAPPA